MRLRYLHLPNYGVLEDLRIPFRREPLLGQLGELSRRGSLHFVVGLNGTGKSSLLRAVFETFRWLEGVNTRAIDARVPFPFTITLIYDLPDPKDLEKGQTRIFHHRGESVSSGFFYAAESSLDEFQHGDWDGWIEWLADPSAVHSSEQGRIVRADALQGNNLIALGLPNPLLAYTSGSLAIWNRVREPELHLDDLSAAAVEVNDYERPRGWDIHQELGSVDVELNASQRVELRRLIDPNAYATELRTRLLDPMDLKLAAITIGLTAAAGEVTRLRTSESRQSWRNALLLQLERQRKEARPEGKSARTLLNEVDWWFPTHLSVEYRPTSAKLNPEWHAQFVVLCALAEEVIRQPLGRMQMVIDLGPTTRQIRDDIKDVYGSRDIPAEINEIIDRVDGSTSGAQALLRTLCTQGAAEYQAEIEPEFARWPVFDRLLAWRKAGLIDHVTVTIKRITKTLAADGEMDDAVVTWDDLSDGEQMLLGRMSLLLLLSDRHGSLLLLDEPETHFNDSWKREIIDIVDDNVLKRTFAHVVVSTHTSIALTDAFASEIIRLVRGDGKSVLKPVTIPTFGAAPSRVMTHVFDMPASIGSRAEQSLRAYMDKGRDNTVEELESLLANIGNGWPIAKLQKLLDEISDAASNS